MLLRLADTVNFALRAVLLESVKSRSWWAGCRSSGSRQRGHFEAVGVSRETLVMHVSASHDRVRSALAGLLSSHAACTPLTRLARFPHVLLDSSGTCGSRTFEWDGSSSRPGSSTTGLQIRVLDKCDVESPILPGTPRRGWTTGKRSSLGIDDVSRETLTR